MTTGIGPYVVPLPTDTDPSSTILETSIVATHGMVDIGGGNMVHAETFNGEIPGPTLQLKVNDTVIVRLVNMLHHPIGIHWHGIELANSSDGTEVTQDGALPMFPVAPPAPAPAGGTYLYKFKVPRPGLYWYHAHHHGTNRVFKGMYGMIVVADPNEAALAATGVLPSATDTKQIVLSDITVCKAPGSNDAATYVNPTSMPLADRAEWLSGATSQPAPTPIDLCEIAPLGSATDDDGNPASASYAAGDVPSMVRGGRINEGQTALTNGVTVGGRLGTPSAPRALAVSAQTLNVLSGQGLRLQIANCAITRYFRLILTTGTGAQVPLVRIGGEGGLLDNAVIEGGVISGFDTKYTQGEIMLPAGSRADMVAAIPSGLPIGSVLTLWTRDFQRNGAFFSAVPTVPVMHLIVTASTGVPYNIANGTPLRASIPGAAVETLGPATGVLLDPATFAPAKLGISNQDIQLTSPPTIDGVIGVFEGAPYTTIAHIDSSRYAQSGQILQLTVTNQSGGHHPFHLHGFSIQPISLTMPGFPTFTWPYREFIDNIDVPSGYTLTFRVHLDDRELKDGMTLGGALGRWLFHCHIFLHHHQGMISELVLTAANGHEKPNVDVRGSWAYTPAGGIAQRFGTYGHPDGVPVTLSASLGMVTDTGGDRNCASHRIRIHNHDRLCRA
jgi:FtsP/CotA-like multicopper oxidase with cupredoxin domain